MQVSEKIKSKLGDSERVTLVNTASANIDGPRGYYEDYASGERGYQQARKLRDFFPK